MDNNEIKLKELVMRLAKCIDSIDSINDETNFIDELGYDSLSLVELIVDIENEFDFEFGYKNIDLDVFKKYENLKRLVLEHCN